MSIINSAERLTGILCQQSVALKAANQRTAKDAYFIDPVFHFGRETFQTRGKQVALKTISKSGISFIPSSFSASFGIISSSWPSTILFFPT